MYLAFHLAVAPRQDDGGGDGLFVAKQPVTETVDFRQSCLVRFADPVLQGITLPFSEHGREALCQTVEDGIVLSFI